MKKKNKLPDKINIAPLELPGLDRIAHMGAGFTILDDKVIIICDKSYARHLLGRGRDKGLPPS